MSVLPSVNVEAASEVAENAKKVDVDSKFHHFCSVLSFQVSRDSF